MATVRLELPKFLPWQKQVLNEAGRFNVVCVGRRAGKTELAQDLVTQTALDRLPSAYCAPTYKMMAQVWQDLRDRLQPICDRVSVTERRLDLMTGGSIEFWSMDNADAVRGRKYARIVLDEAAQMPGLWRAFHAVLRPTLTDYVGDAWFLSTPLGRNDFWTLYQLHTSDPDWRAWQMPSAVNAKVNTPAEIEAMCRTMPDRTFSQEIMAEFLEDGGAVFRYVRRAVNPAEPNYDHTHIIGVDWGKSEDYTVMAVVDVQDGRCCELDRSNRVDYAVQRGRLAALCERYRPIAVIAESNAMGEPIIEQLQRENLPVRGFTTTNASKAAIIDGLALAFERGDISIPDDTVLISELEAYTAERLPSGLLRYGAPQGMHDDTVMALALAWHGASVTVDGPLMV